MQRKIITTADGSKTIYLPEWNEHYHSKHGAIQEANHVFIEKGLFHVSQMSKRISILEMGFGTGLNALITFLEAKKLGLQIDYTGVEAYPVGKEEMNSLNYAEHFNDRGIKEVFKMLHDIPWQERNEITNNFSLTKRKQFFFEITDEDQFDLIYFDAFGPRVQPELWTKEIFKKMFLALKHNGV
ncbi:MAG: tRNA (5-methylaminomethyl-2-thiouridine)(34)-methyltransferase MnmD, partial [Flavobacteriaceae bacterium]|nr:tRNA (5-methylaminomethyl-2-thiouridine)(34)-methyltransferase MnmD [Flavobacteriaceae bacterium]